MSRNSWLVHEFEWSRKQELEARERAANLRDPEWVQRRTKTLIRNREHLWEQLRAWWDLTSEMSMLADDEQREETAARAEKDAGHWKQLADDASHRLEQTEAGQDSLLDP